VPLTFSLCKNSSNYFRRIFENGLADVIQYYDCDFKKFKFNNNTSQPYTPAFTYAGTNAISKKEQINQSMVNSLGG
jgi:hypothetical protein